MKKPEINVKEFIKGIVKWYNSEQREFVKLKILEDLKPIKILLDENGT